MATSQSTERALAFRILDLGGESGAYGGKLLADMGADVIKIEPPEGDCTRRKGPFFRGEPNPERSFYFMGMNTNKRGITLDLETSAGREVFKELVKTADAVIESFPVGYLASLGLGYEDLIRINPKLVMTSVTPFGQTGPYRHFEGTDITAWAMGGIQTKAGQPDRPPLNAPGLAYIYSGVNAAVGTLAALWARQSTGTGQHVDISMHETIVAVTSESGLPKYLDDLVLLQRNGCKYVGVAPAGFYPCKDGAVCVVAGSPPQWDRQAQWIVDATGNETALDDIYKGTVAQRWVVKEAVYFLCESLTVQFTKRELFEEAMRRDVAVTPLNTIEDLFNDPQLKARNFWTEMDHPQLGKLTYPGAPYILSESPWSLRHPAPRLGEHNEEILVRELGMSPGTLGTLNQSRGSGNRDSRRIDGEPSETARRLISKPLEGVRIVFMGAGIAGPFAARYLSALGAEVIKVSAASRLYAEGSGTPPWEPKLGLVPDFPSTGDLNANHLNLGLELRHPKGMEIFKKLIKISDVVQLSYGASVPAKLGIEYEALRKIKEDIIMIHMAAFGTTGPYRNYDLWGTNVSPMTGLDHMIGYPDLPEPEGNAAGGVTLTDYIGGYSGVLAMLMALHYRARTGKGQHIDLALMDVTVGSMGPAVLDFVSNGIVAGPRGNQDPYAAPHGTYQCKGEDRWCSIAVRTEKQWQGLCRAIDPSLKDSLASDPRFATLSDRLKNQDELDRLIEEFTSQLDPYEVMFLMRDHGVPAGVVQTNDDLILRDLQLQARDFWVKLPVEKRGHAITMNVPIKMSATPPKLTRGQAVLSQDNDYVLKGLLGLTDKEVAELLQEGAICAPIPGDPSLKNRSLSARWTGRLGSSLPRADELKWSS